MGSKKLNRFGDIVCGRGCGQLSMGDANLRFKRLLAGTQWIYDQADKEKRILCSIIVQFILDRGGRFVVAPVEAIREQKAQRGMASSSNKASTSNRDSNRVLRERSSLLSAKFKRSKFDLEVMSMDKSIDKVGQTFRDLRTLRDIAYLRFDQASQDETLQLASLHKLIAEQVHIVDWANSSSYSPRPKSVAVTPKVTAKVTAKVSPKRKSVASKSTPKKVTTPSCVNKSGNNVGIKRPRGKRLTPRFKAHRQVPPRVSPMQTPRRVSLAPMDNIEKHTTEPGSEFLTIVPASRTSSCRSVTPIAGVLGQSSNGCTPLSEMEQVEGSESPYLDLISATASTESLISEYLQPIPRRVSLLATTSTSRDSHASSTTTVSAPVPERIPDDFWDLEDDRPSSSIHPNLIVPVSPIRQQPRVVNMDPLFFLTGNHDGVVVSPHPGCPTATNSRKVSCTEEERGGHSSSTPIESNDTTCATALYTAKQEGANIACLHDNSGGFTPTFWEVCMPAGGPGQQIRGIF